MACVGAGVVGIRGKTCGCILVIDEESEEPAGRPGMEPTVRLELTTC